MRYSKRSTKKPKHEFDELPEDQWYRNRPKNKGKPDRSYEELLALNYSVEDCQWYMTDSEALNFQEHIFEEMEMDI